MDTLVAIANQFTFQGRVVEIQEFGNGNINRTFRVTLEGAEARHFILQQINTQVFRQPEQVMQNMCIFTQHARQRLQATPLATGRRWQVPCVLPTRDDRNCWFDVKERVWRAIEYIEGVRSFDTVQNRNLGQEIGIALGTFHWLLSDLPVERLADTLPGFHITPDYLQHYDAVQQTRPTREVATAEVEYCLQFVRDRRNLVPVLENARAAGKLQLRPIHGDPKINNILIDTTTGQAVSMVDLDTVKPGLIHYDIGDCLRSGCNPLGEETPNWQTVRFDLDLCETILQGYLSVASTFLTANDRHYLYDAMRLIAFELGLRFLTDYLEGNVYFKVNYPENNLARALVQFKLTESIESQEGRIRQLIRSLSH